MVKQCIAAAVILLLVSQAAPAQDARTVIGNATRIMGSENLNSITYYGSGANFGLGQSNNSNGPWPRTNINDYRRSIDFTQPASRATAVTYIAPVTGGPATQGAFNQNITPANTAWAQQLEIWITPWGFLKGAAANNATVRAQTIGGTRYNVLTWMSPQKSPSGLSYRVNGYINGQTNLVDRVETWLENPIFGDMHVEAIYSDYRDNRGLKFPGTIIQKRGGSATFEAQLLSADANPANIQQLVTPPPPAQRGGTGAGQAGQAGQAAAAAAPPPSVKLADGVFQIAGNGYNSLAVEFRDHIVLFEGGAQNETRAAAIIEEAKKVIPNKPVRYSITSHHHFDHTSGLPAVVAEGATIITHELNKAFFERALGAPRTLAADAMSKSGNKAKIETVVGDKRVLQDDTRVLEIHRIQGLPHADGMLVAYLPKEKILAFADMFNIPPATDPVPNPPVVGTQIFEQNLQRLQLDVERIMSVHPQRIITRADIRKSLGMAN